MIQKQKTMRAFRLLEYGRPGQYCDVPIPVPAKGEVLIRMKAAGLCRSDLDMVDSLPGSDPYASAVDAPYTLGHENAGVIEALGEGVTDLKIGEGVAVRHMPHCSHCEYCIRGASQHCLTHRRGAIEINRGTGWDGGLAEFMICPRDQLVSIGDEDPVKYAPLTDAGVTAYGAFGTVKARLRPGTSAIVLGAGGLGVYAIQFLKMLVGVKVYAVDKNPSRTKIATELGVDKVFEAGSGAAKQILEETNGKGVDGILDFVGSSESLNLACAISRPGGRIVLVGMEMGTVELGWNKIATSCEFAISLGSTRQDLEEVCLLAREGKLRIDMDKFSFDEVPKAYDALRNGRLTGRAVVVFE
jgi:propanol-preferring alcohol dehydrogenase